MKRMAATDDWDDLSEEEKRYSDKRMSVYAGMVDAMDHHIGRLIQYLKESGQYDNTVIIFTSDNGPAAGDVPLLWINALGYNRDYETLGERYSYGTIGASFGSAVASPLGHYKFHSGEGGIRVPLIISGPQVADSHRGRISHSRAFVKDLAPTILALAGTHHPGTQYKGKAIEASTGKNLLPVIAAQTDSVYTDEDVITYEIGGNAALIKGDYKITLNRGGTNDGRWHLYNITEDPGETEPLETVETTVFFDLLAEYETYARENGVIPVPKNYYQPAQILRNGLTARFKNSVGSPTGQLITLILGAVIILLMTRKLTRRSLTA